MTEEERDRYTKAAARRSVEFERLANLIDNAPDVDVFVAQGLLGFGVLERLGGNDFIAHMDELSQEGALIAKQVLAYSATLKAQRALEDAATAK